METNRGSKSHYDSKTLERL